KAQRFDVVLLDHKLDRQTGVSESLPILSRHLGDAKVIVVSDFIASIDQNRLPPIVSVVSTKERLPGLIEDMLRV
ncbi:MAG: hypothetical protein AB8B88_05595, partial [Devosiaceae bacterium]